MWQLLTTLLLFFPMASMAQTHEYQLSNGLKLIVKEDHRAPIVLSQICYKVGSSYEHGGITGISHALEHMMFKGTTRTGLGKFDQMMASQGAEYNAFTADDYTCYYEKLPAHQLAMSFDLEADRMHNLIFDKNEFAKEIQVVMEERRLRTDDNPKMRAYERFNAAAFISSPYHHLTIGWMNDLQNMTIDDVRQWYKTWYTPRNAVLVVVGDVDPAQVLQLAKHYFEPVPATPLPPLKPQPEIVPLGKREVLVNVAAQLPSLMMGYNVPSLKTADPSSDAYALEVLSAILDAGQSSRLSKDLIRKNPIASSISADYELHQRLDTLFLITATPAPGHSIEELKTAILNQIRRLRDEKVDPQEFARAKTQLIADNFYSRDSIADQAEEISALENINLSWRTAASYEKNIRAVTPEQLQTVARRYLIDDRLTIGILQPLATSAAKVSPMISPQDLRHVH